MKLGRKMREYQNYKLKLIAMNRNICIRNKDGKQNGKITPLNLIRQMLKKPNSCHKLHSSIKLWTNSNSKCLICHLIALYILTILSFFSQIFYLEYFNTNLKQMMKPTPRSHQKYSMI